MATYYWVGGNGNWYDGAHWATTSGGTGNAFSSGQGPGPCDNIIFNSASSASSYFVSFSGGGGTGYDWNINPPASGTLTISGDSSVATKVFNSLTIAATRVSASMSRAWSITSTTKQNVFQPEVVTSNSMLINTNNASNIGSFNIDTGSTTSFYVNLGSAFTCNSLTFTSGVFNAAGYNITCSDIDVYAGVANLNNISLSCSNFQTQFGSVGPSVINLTGTIVTARGTLPAFFQGTNHTCVFDKVTKIQITGVHTFPSVNNIGNNVPGMTLPHIEIKTTSIVVASGIVVDKLTMTGGQTLKITSSYTVNVNNISFEGTPTISITLYGDGGPVTKANFVKNGGYMDMTGVNVSDVAFSGTATKRAWQSTGTRVTGITVNPGKKPPEASFLIFC